MANRKPLFLDAEGFPTEMNQSSDSMTLDSLSVQGTAGITMVSGTVSGLPLPTANSEAASKLYVDLATASGSGITELQHRALRDVIHFIDGPGDGFASGAYRETVGGPFPTSVTWYESNTKTEKIIEQTIARPSKATPTPIVWKMYDSDGSTVLVTVQDDISYDGVFETSRTRTIIV